MHKLSLCMKSSEVVFCNCVLVSLFSCIVSAADWSAVNVCSSIINFPLQSGGLGTRNMATRRQPPRKCKTVKFNLWNSLSTSNAADKKTKKKTAVVKSTSSKPSVKSKKSKVSKRVVKSQSSKPSVPSVSSEEKSQSSKSRKKVVMRIQYQLYPWADNNLKRLTHEMDPLVPEEEELMYWNSQTGVAYWKPQKIILDESFNYIFKTEPEEIVKEYPAWTLPPDKVVEIFKRRCRFFQPNGEGNALEWSLKKTGVSSCEGAMHPRENHLTQNWMTTVFQDREEGEEVFYQYDDIQRETGYDHLYLKKDCAKEFVGQLLGTEKGRRLLKAWGVTDEWLVCLVSFGSIHHMMGREPVSHVHVDWDIDKIKPGTIFNLGVSPWASPSKNWKPQRLLAFRYQSNHPFTTFQPVR